MLDDLAALGCRKVHFSGGEPTLRPDLPDIMAHARRLKLRVTLTTNGTLLTRELSRQLVKAGLNSVCVSIDSPVRSVHDRMRGMPGALKQTLAGVRELRRAAKQRGVIAADSHQHRRQPRELRHAGRTARAGPLAGRARAFSCCPWTIPAASCC